MHNFSQTAIKLLSDYKNLLKKQLDPNESARKLAQLGLDKRIPKREGDLYRLLLKVVKKAHMEENDAPSRLRYSGIDRFVRHMKEALDNYRLENGQVIHMSQTASRAMIEAIQLIPLPELKLTDGVAAKLDSCAHLIAKYGAEEQKKVFMNSIKMHLSRRVEFFLPLLNRFRGHLAESICLEESEQYLPINGSSENTEDIAC